MFARIYRGTGELERRDDFVAMLRDKVMPLAEKQPGFDGLLFLVGPISQDVYAISFWRTEEDMTASNELGKRLGDEFAREFNLNVQIVCSEVAFSKLPALIS